MPSATRTKVTMLTLTFPRLDLLEVGDVENVHLRGGSLERERAELAKLPKLPEAKPEPFAFDELRRACLLAASHGG
jgi:nitrogen fixation protein